jgi:hypothetical protein
LAEPSGRSVRRWPRLCSAANGPQPRYVVLGTGAALRVQNELAANADNSVKSSRKGLKATSSKPSLVDVAQLGPDDRRLYISLYKAKVESRIFFFSLAQSCLTFGRVIGNLCRSIPYLPSNHAKFELFNIESKALLFQR